MGTDRGGCCRLQLVFAVELGEFGGEVNLAGSRACEHGGGWGRRVVRSRGWRVARLGAVLKLRFGCDLNELRSEGGRWRERSGRGDWERTGRDSDLLRLVGRSPDSGALHNSLPDVLERFLLGFVLIGVPEVVLEEGRGGSGGGRSQGGSGRVVGFGIIPLGGVGGMGLGFLLVGFVGVARVAGHVGELPFVAVGVDVAVLAADYAVCATRFFFERTIGRFVTKCETTIIIDLESRK